MTVRVLVSTAVSLSLLFVAIATTLARADVVVDKQQRGVRGRVVVAPELFTTPVPVTGERERLLRTPAIVRRALGRPVRPIVEPAPALTVMLEGEFRQLPAESQNIRLEGMRFLPGTLVLPRAMSIQVENRQAQTATIVEGNVALASIPPGGTVDIPLKTGEHLLSVKELGFATASVRVLDHGHVLPVQNGEIPLVDIAGGEYTLTFFLGAEPLRIQPLVVPEGGLLYMDASVSALRVVEVSVKDASMRFALPPVMREVPDGIP